MSIYRCVLTDQPEVARQAQLYPVCSEFNHSVYTIPDEFDGRDIWGTYLIAPSSTTTHSATWAIVAKDVLNDRFCLQSGGQLLTNFDEFEIISCVANPPHTISKEDPPYSRSTQGYSIFDAWEYLYQYGVCQQLCFPVSEISKRGITPPDDIPGYVEKMRTYGVNCAAIENPGRTGCLTKRDGKPIARRAFLCDAIYRVGNGKTWEESLRQIKSELTRYGPVAAGMVLYENFVEGVGNTDPKKWRGYTPYDKVQGKVVGQMYVSIVGYTETHWICRGTFGANWGLLGYFKIKIGLKECRLEENVSTCMPYLYVRRNNGEDRRDGLMKDGKKVNLYDMKAIYPLLAESRAVLHIDFSNFYSTETILQIREGRLSGDLTPLIKFPKLLPDMRYFWVKDILNYSYPTLSGEKTDKIKVSRKLWFLRWSVQIIGMVIAFFIGYDPARFKAILS